MIARIWRNLLIEFFLATFSSTANGFYWKALKVVWNSECGMKLNEYLT